MRILFVKRSLAWPRSSGHDVHTYYVMRQLAARGHTVSLFTLETPAPQAVAGLNLAELTGPTSSRDVHPGTLSDRSRSYIQERFRGYWGVSNAVIHDIGCAARRLQADAVVVVGLEVLPYLLEVDGATRVWYAADEWVWHHLSQVQPTREGWSHLRAAAIKGVYERSYAPILDQIWVCSDADRRAMRRVTGHRNVSVIANGVDLDNFCPTPQATANHASCAFWGRLDFGPNIDALDWFCNYVWPDVHRKNPAARFHIYGFNPGERVGQLARRPGISLAANVVDLPATLATHSIAVLPFRSGGGIKNKLLEAAALKMAIVCSPRACNGLRLTAQPPFVVADTPAKWGTALRRLMGDPQAATNLGAQAYAWVAAHHSWPEAAQRAELALQQKQPV